jgi:hypothetical protein
MTSDISVRKQALESLARLSGRVEALKSLEPESIGGSPAFVAFLNALARPLTTYLEWSEQLLLENGAADDPSEDPQVAADINAESPGAKHVRASGVRIVADTERLRAAVDAFIAEPLSDSVRLHLVALLDEVLRPVLATVEPHAASHDNASPPSSGLSPASSPAPAAGAALAGESGSHRRDASDQGPDPGQPKQRHRPSDDSAARRRGDASSIERIPERAPREFIAERLRLNASEHDAWQERFERLSRRMNTGFVLMGAVGLGLLALNVQETFFRPQAGAIALQEETLRTDPGSALPDQTESVPMPAPDLDLAPLEALVRQLQASGEDIATSLAAWSSGPGEAIPELNARMLVLETEVSRLKVGMDAIGTGLQSTSEQGVIADEGETTPLRDDVEPADLADSQAPMQTEPALSRVTTTADIDGEALVDSSSVSGGDVETEGGEPLDDSVTDRSSADMTPPSFTFDGPAGQVLLAAPAYGIQLGAMRGETGARSLATNTGLDPDSLFIHASGSWQFVLLGWFSDRDEARTVLKILPRSVRRERPLIRFLDAGSLVKPLNVQ